MLYCQEGTDVGADRQTVLPLEGSDDDGLVNTHLMSPGHISSLQLSWPPQAKLHTYNFIAKLPKFSESL